MADKKNMSQAERAASGKQTHKQPKKHVKKEPSGKQPKSKSSGKKSNTQTLEIRYPGRLIGSVASAGLFILFLVILLVPEGALVQLFYRGVVGLIGRTGFYISIPALLYLFIILAFSGDRPVVMRSTCLISFVLICSCLVQLWKPFDAEGISVIGKLYTGGANGSTSGIICGGIGLLLNWLLNPWLSTIVLVICGIILLLAAFQITIPSIIRAMQDRPRAEWELEEKEDKPEPASVVVNHIATKRIEYIENKRRKQQEAVDIDVPLDGEKPAKKKARPVDPKTDNIMRQIDDIDAPVSAADEPVADDSQEILDQPKQRPTKAEKEAPIPAKMPPLVLNDPIPEAPVVEPAPAPAEPIPEKVTAKEAKDSAAQVAAEIAQNAAADKPIYCFPPIDLLKRGGGSSGDGTAEMRENSRRLNETLASFKIEAHIINVTRGPSVTRYEVELEKGVRLNKLTTVADDIALSLGASGVRIAAVPGKISVVGIEVPNRAVTTVALRDVIDSSEFAKAKSKSSFAVGKDIGGSCIVGNIAKLPHMLIAGTTGSGKSVCMNSIIISLLYKASPDDVKLIMVDPKMVELGIYNGIPHLLIPVVTDPKKAAGSLQWAVTEMMRRYKAMSDAGVRDLESYNSIIESEEGNKLPQVVVIIDELADLMLVAAKEVEESICRIAQMGRAAGIHLIIATQRPSADVITGLMKANIPSRIAFSVASAMESRIILDTQGAEKLVGRGDMLFAPIGSGKPLRVQGCFVSDPEVEAVANYVKENYISSYDQTVLEEIEKKAAQTGSKSAAATAADPEPTADELDGDEMLPAAVDVILETGQASVSMLQRRLKLGYARAARIVDEMEEKGIVGPFQGSKPRAILITKEKWESMKSGEPAQMQIDDLPFDEDLIDEFE